MGWLDNVIATILRISVRHTDRHIQHLRDITMPRTRPASIKTGV